ncbi:Serine/threonine-protein phosphatase 2A activator [Choanephora cucurbitarum]|uniref:Serine/threonine-protein phosphatase 2A activator n=1 Tax=Choanephora cucurbitarum TaxID=101091 RepID=A0A1C7NDD2_9FUNG|nr:Serine/threonine-protein phosphatase 2A activator [Choanephora cucurbitarum]
MLQLPNISQDYQPQEPIACIQTQRDIDRFVQTKAFERIMTFVALLNDSVMGSKVSDPCFISTQTQSILDLLTTLDSWVDAIPPLDQPQRFGNKAFRQFILRLQQSSDRLQREALPESMHLALPELTEYLVHGFGNETRIDYGSGHELSFVAWLAGIAMLGGFEPEDYQAIVLRIFVQYLELVRKIQKRYTLEPAGSHGVWGLDDHQFLPYVWGSAQLINHPQLKPNAIQSKDTVHAMAADYMYFRCIQFILEVKRGPFFEHSPMLNDIASVISWSKVNSGMTKMFIAEVLKKVPVVQHFKFGRLFPFE